MRIEISLLLVAIVTILALGIIPLLASLVTTLLKPTNSIWFGFKNRQFRVVDHRRQRRSFAARLGGKVEAFKLASLVASAVPERFPHDRIVIDLCVGDEPSLDDDDAFRLVVFGTAGKAEEFEHPGIYLGTLRINCTTGLTPSGMGHLVVDDALLPIGEFVGRNALYLLVDDLPSKAGEAREFLHYLFRQVLALRGTSTEERRKLSEQLVLEKRGRSRRALGEVTADRTLMKALAQTDHMLKTGRAALDKSIHEIRTARAEVERGECLTTIDQGDLEQREQESLHDVEKIGELPQVERVETTATHLLVYTHPLTCRALDGSLRDIGRFRIEVALDGSDGAIRWFNLDRRVEGLTPLMHAPHILPDGRSFSGAISTVVPPLIGKKEYVQVTKLAIRWIEKFNPRDPLGAYITRWPIVQTA
ncbi:MAG: hypothetical protein KDD64_08780 [Bdellovibrionales bacterium]|nr:hypothetical protein [Bdellovibrionales bacterium]